MCLTAHSLIMAYRVARRRKALNLLTNLFLITIPLRLNAARATLPLHGTLRTVLLPRSLPGITVFCGQKYGPCDQDCQKGEASFEKGPSFGLLWVSIWEHWPFLPAFGRLLIHDILRIRFRGQRLRIQHYVAASLLKTSTNSGAISRFN